MADRKKATADEAGRRPGRNTTYQAEAYKNDPLAPIRPQDLMDPDATGHEIEGEDGFHQATAMFDKGQFLGDLADLQDGGPDTRAAVGTADAPKGCRLIIVAGADVGLEWGFKQPEVVIGRDEDCQLVLSDIAVSRKHAKITLEGARFFLSDLGSGNGTLLNGARIDARVELSAGDEIVIGERTMRFVELNEAPPTAAAHPISPGGREPLVGDPGSIEDEEDSFRPLGRASQVDVGAVGDDEPAISTKQLPKAKAEPPPRGAALKTTAMLLGGIALFLALGVGGWLVWESHREAQAKELAVVRARREFLQGIELVKAKRCGDAMILFNRVLAVRPDHPRAKDYADYCKKELQVWAQLEGAEKLAGGGRYNQAIEHLEGIDEQSRYAEDAASARERYNVAIAKRLVGEAQSAFEQKEYESALDLVARALERAPNLRAARDLLDLIEAEARKPRGGEKRPKPAVPPLMMRAVALYKNDQIGAAIDAAEAVGGPEAQVYVENMQQMKKLMATADEAFRQKAAGELLRIAPNALDIDKRISGGEGKIRDKLINMHATGLYLKGVAAFGSGDFVEAYRLLEQATRVKPGHVLAESRLRDIAKKAEQIYFEGYVLKDSNKAETRKKFKQLIAITPPSNQYHKKASDWLEQNGG
jgi:tetratricopeptide (TPR) repeat protein